MGRKKTYEFQELITSLTYVFWRKGYRSTSIVDLEQASGLNRKSLFHAFGSKEELFERVLQHYLEIKAQPLAAPLLQVPRGPDNIRRFFEAIRYDEQEEMGCLLALTALERESVPPAAFRLVQGVYQQIQKIFVDNLGPAIKTGQVTRAEARALAEFYASSLHGIVVAGRAGATNGQLKRVVRVILSTLPDGRAH